MFGERTRFFVLLLILVAIATAVITAWALNTFAWVPGPAFFMPPTPSSTLIAPRSSMRLGRYAINDRGQIGDIAGKQLHCFL